MGIKIISSKREKIYKYNCFKLLYKFIFFPQNFDAFKNKSYIKYGFK